MDANFITTVLHYIFSDEVPIDWEKIKEHEMRIWRYLILATGILVLIPVIGLIITLIFKKSWITFSFGLIVLSILGILFLIRPLYLGLAGLIGVLRGIAYKKKDMDDAAIEAGRKWIDTVLVFILWELIVIGFCSIFPVWKNPYLLPGIAFSSIIIALMIHVWEFKAKVFQKVAFMFMVVTLLVYLTALVYPKTVKAVLEKIPSDSKMAVSVSKTDIKSIKKSKDISPKSKPPRRTSGIFNLPGDGTVIEQTEGGYELPYPTGIFVHFEQNGTTPGKFRLMNKPGDKYGSWTTSLFRGVSGPTNGPGTIKLSSADGKPHKIKVWLSRYRT